MAAASFVFFVPDVGWKWAVRDGADTLYESEGGFATDTEAAAVASATLGNEWPGSETDTTWHYVGEAGEPAFENSWATVSGSDLPRTGFRFREAGVVDLSLFVDGGSASTVFTIPADYWPSDTAVMTGVMGFVAGTPRPGHVSVSTNGIVGLSSAAFHPAYYIGFYYLDPPETVP